MAEKTDLNVTPYHDDFNEDKNFHKVLFRAGRPLQARELTQSQSILQNQVERFGNHVFEEGSLVEGAQSDVVYDYAYVKVENTNPNSSGDSDVVSYIDSFKGKYLQGATSGAVAEVYLVEKETSDDPHTLIVKYLAGGTDTANSFYFLPSEQLKEVTLDSDGNPSLNISNNNHFTVQANAQNPVGRSSVASLTEGVIYIRGFFVKVDAAQLVLEKYSGTPSYRVGIDISEQLISSADDTSLLDNATGTTNENAPGADRFKIGTTFTKKLISSTDDTNFVELLRIRNGITELKVSQANYNEFEGTLARRTFDTNGDFVVKQFVPIIREHLRLNDNQGYYAATNGGASNKFVLQVSPGKAYVRGYEVNKNATTPISIGKARTTKTLTGTATSARIGNYLKVTNTHSVPEFGNEGGQDTLAPNQVIKLYDAVISSAGTEPSSGHIGFARVRNYDEQETVDANTDGVFEDTSTFQLYLFDVKMFTKISYSAHSGTANAGDIVTGGTSGATGIIAYDNNSDALFIHDVVGTFVSGEAITSAGDGDFALSTSQNTAVRSFNIDRVRGVSQTPSNAAREKYTADVVLDLDKVLSGTLTFSNSSTAVTGFATRFLDELKEGDIVISPIGEERIVSSVTSATALTLTNASGGSSGVTGNATRRRAKLNNQNQTANIFAFARDHVKSFTPDSCVVRRQTTVQIASQGFTITAGSGNTFPAVTSSNINSHVEMAIIEEASGSPTLNNGDVLDPRDYFTSLSGTSDTITFGNMGTANNGAIVKISYTVNIGSPTNRDKTLRTGRMVEVSKSRSTGGFYGACYDDREISLGVSDVFKVRGIYEAPDSTSDALPPNATVTQVSSFAFTDGEVVKGQSSGARAKIINYSGDGNTSYFYYINNKQFVASESIVGESSSASGTLSNVSQGGKNIIDRYFFDDGQRDGFYDYGKIQRKQGAAAPSNKILIIFDYFTHGAGNFFDVNSYNLSDVLYEEIPVYAPNKVDLGGLEPDGQFELTDAVDYRPVLDQLIGTTNFATQDINPTDSALVDLSDTSTGLTDDPFRYESKDFASSSLDIPAVGSATQGDLVFYVPRIDKVFLNKTGQFQTSGGIPSLTPTKPKAVDDAIEMFELFIPAYTADVKKIKIKTVDHRRFTMKDIAKIQNRVANLERLTTLSLLERDTKTLQIQDADGFDRFKSGFVVDSFKGHGVGDVSHPDYGVGIDVKKGMMRPQTYTSFFDIAFNSSSSGNFTKTGDILTLPYSQISYVNQDKASDLVNVNPYNVFAFIGNLKLSPETDVWNDTERLPEVRINREGNYDAVVAENNNALGTIWNNWQTTWVGEPNVVSTEVISSRPGAWSGDPAQDGEWVPGEEVTRVITETPEQQTRTGISTTVVEDFVETRNDRTVSVSVIPFIRARRVTLDATNLQPNRNHFIFFDGLSIGEHITPFSSAYGVSGNTAKGTAVKSDRNGRLRAHFDIPNNDTIRFATGQREVKITSSSSNLSNPASFATRLYQAQGLLQSTQTEVVTTRNGRLVREQQQGGRSIVRAGELFNRTAIDTTAPPIPPDDPPDDPPLDPPLNPPANKTYAVTAPASINEGSTGTFTVSGTNLDNGEILFYTVTNAGDFVTFQGSVSITNNAASFTLTPRADATTEGQETAQVQLRIGSVNGTIVAFDNFVINDTSTTPIVDDDDDDPITTPPFDPPLDPPPPITGGGSIIGDSMNVALEGDGVGRTEQDLWQFPGAENEFAGWEDPLAQSFLVEARGGMMVTSVDVFFQSKDASLPVTMEIRNMVNGYPGPMIYPFSEKTLNPSEVNLSEDGSSATTFTFDSPVFLEQGQEYCFVLLSNSDAYNVWVSTMGEKDVKTGQIISGQPYAGSLFKSQNASTWTAEQTQDLKFNLKIAKFDTSKQPTLIFENVDIDDDTLQNNPISTTSGSQDIIVAHYTHGMYDTSSYVTLSGITGDRQNGIINVDNGGITVESGSLPADGTYSNVSLSSGSGSGAEAKIVISGGAITEFKITDCGSGYSATDNVKAVNFSGTQQVSIDVDVVGDTLGGIPISVLNGTHSSIRNPQLDQYEIRPNYSTTDFDNASGATETTQGGGLAVKASRNYYFDSLHTMIPSVVPKSTRVVCDVQLCAMKSPEGHINGTAYTMRNTSQFITLNDNNFLDAPSIVASPINESSQSSLSGGKSFKAQISMLSLNPNISPMIDVSSMGVIANANRVNGLDSTGTQTIALTKNPDGESNAMTYITKRVDLKNPATAIKLFLDGFSPINTDIKVMFKTLKNDEATPFDDVGFEFFNTDGSPDIVVDKDGKNFKEYEFSVDNLAEFSAFSIKIVGQANNTSVVPLVQNLRAIALAT